MMSIVMDVRLFFTIAINVRWLHIVITKGDMALPIRRKNRAPHILIIVVVVSLFLSSSSSWYPRRCILVISFYLVAYPRLSYSSSEVLCTSGCLRWTSSCTWERGIAHLNAHNCLHMGRIKGHARLQMGRIVEYFPWV